MIILGIETSCDETAAAVARCSGDKIKILSNVAASQIEIHKKYGGVVPEVAAREHVLNILPVINEALEKARVNFVNAIAVTVGPGLITSLLAGVETAKALAYVWRVPVVAVNHIEGHIYANWLALNAKHKIKFPAVILTVSGGHTMLILMSGHGKYKVLGQTRDDAAGEAFDKAAQLLGLEYPGGPAIAAEAEKNKKIKICLPRPMINSDDFDFSFSGLKTALLYAVKSDKNWKKKIPEYAAEFQQAVIDVLIKKTIKAALKYNVKNVMLAGGVAANAELRNQLKSAVAEKLPGTNLHVPESRYCVDNAAMIAAAGYFHAKRNDLTRWQKLKADANLEK